MTPDTDYLSVLCPMHVTLNQTGHIVRAGPTLAKICGVKWIENARFLEVFEVYRPRTIGTMQQLLSAEGRKLHLRLRGPRRTAFKGLLVRTSTSSCVVNLSFGIGVVDGVRQYALTASDFAATDLAVEMLYLVEAKSAAMDASRRLNTRLQGARLDAEARAFTDTLTGLGNRRALDKVLSGLSSSREPFALMHLDLDFFKQVNDTLGHGAGDHVLQSVAHAMNDMTRRNDIVARVGGDEFTIICPGLTSSERLSELASALIERIEKPLCYQNQTCAISVSIGICISQPGGVAAQDTLELADAALYAAKNAGRAQFRFAEIANAQDGT